MSQPSRLPKHRFAVTSHAPVIMLVLGVGLALLSCFDPIARGPDIATYLGFARSLFFDGDILLFNEFPILERKLFVTPTGYATALQNIGAAFFLLPWYAVAHGSVWLTNTLSGAELSTDGFNALYLVWLNFGHWLYGVAALAVCYRWCRRYASRPATWLAVLFVTLASPFFYYITAFIPNAAIPSALSGALFVSVWDDTRRAPTAARWFLLGALAGVLLCLANYNLTFLCLPLVSFTTVIVNNWSGQFEQKRSTLTALFAVSKGAVILKTAWFDKLTMLVSPIIIIQLSLFALGTLIGFMPQLLTWRILFGNPLANPYASQLAWLQPHIAEVLFSSYHGLFFYAPFLALALLGLIPLWRRDRTLTLSLMLTFVAQAYISSVNLGWWAGGSFGQRYFLALTPLFMLCAASLFAFHFSFFAAPCAMRLTPYFLLITSFLCFAWTYLLFLGVFANHQDIVYYYPPAAQWANQLANLAALPRLLSAHLLTIKSPLAPIMLLPFMLLVGLLALMARQLSRSSIIQSPRFIVACALLPLLPTLIVLRADSIGASHLQALQTQAAYLTLPRAANDPDDTSYTYTERAVYHLRSGNARAATDDWRQAQALLPTNTWTVLRVADLAYLTPTTAWQVNSDLTLSAYALETTTQTARLTLYWSVQHAPVPTYTVQIAALDAHHQTIGQVTQLPTHGQYPFSQWQTGDLLRDTYTIPLTVTTPPTFTSVLTVSFAAHQTFTHTLHCEARGKCLAP